jgi:16S rRNA C1402 (ribose-2'-O) methylase RsmI
VNELIHNIGTNDLKGEITLVISNKEEDSKNISNVDLIKEIKLLLNKMSSKDISEYLAEKLKISKKIIYQNVLKINK